ncbi:serine hydrolase domain-containing protein [Actinomadura namibiensis]|uniref:D-alanyl-D-alanine carboxypeptidase n=1 Tax=Actinomadura namibiensis TaxID=182080 RepID=A0A7W3QJX5_ACTNM|nr:serine hydrolase domain-containing protein [Actinomadura namibiensis]MBA8949840.1 D-alanyl-D-alanine carboxypeptidase [Actinomadura namibiensis]
MRRPLTAAALTAALTGALAAPAAASAGAAPPAGLRAAADRLVAAGQPGVIVMARRGAKVSHVTAGVADRATGRPMDHRLRVRIASVTKTFTATVLLQLVAERRLSLDDTVERRLPGLVPGGEAITIRHLLQHTSGLPEYTTDQRIMAEPRRAWTPRELVAIALEKPRPHAPGAGWTYANTNYILAGMIIERVTGRPFGTELQRRILTPLGLRHTSYPTVSRAFPGPYVHGYWEGYGDVSTEVSPSSARTSGGIVSTVDDVARFHRALFTGRLLPKAQQRALTATLRVTDGGAEKGYGLGVEKVRLSCGDAWGHDGGFPGYRTWTYTSADGRRQAVIAYNDNSARFESDPGFRADRARAAEAAFCG